LPSVGRLEHFEIGQDGRVETGVEEGDAISPFYDPMIAKLIASGETREDAIAGLADMLDEVEVWPVRTNAGFLFNTVLHEDFAAGRIGTGFIQQHLDELVPDPEPDEAIWRGAASIALALDEEDAALADLSGFRLNAPPAARVALGRGGAFRTVSLDGDEPIAAVSGFRDDERVVAFHEGQAYEFDLAARGTVGAGVADGVIVAPMPGRVASVGVAQGENVTKGQRLLTLEAMKMEHGLTAPFDGVVADLNAESGAQVVEGAVLARVEPTDESPPSRSS
jgi:3-methylcrotonyl-CoA carboxylase alpha subunit